MFHRNKCPTFWQSRTTVIIIYSETLFEILLWGILFPQLTNTMLPKCYMFMVALESNRKSSWWKRESLRIFCLAVLASLYGVCSYGGSPGGNHLYLQSLKPPHTRNFQNFHFRNTTNLGRLLRGWMKEIDTTGSESILKLKMLQVVEVFFADREGLIFSWSVFLKPYFSKYQTHTKTKHTITIGGYTGVANYLSRGWKWAPGSQTKTIWF